MTEKSDMKVEVTKVDVPTSKVLKARLKQPWTWAGLLAIIGSVLADPTVLHFISNYFLAVEAGRGWIGAIGIAFGSAVLFWQQQHPVQQVSANPDMVNHVVRAAATAGIAARLFRTLRQRKEAPADDNAVS